jgi:Domain of unknown function (DUF4432)
MRTSSCSVQTGTVAGWTSVELENDALHVTVLPGKGADVYAFVDREIGVDALFKAPWGLQPPGSPAREGSGGVEFLTNYEGGWQELLPNANDACTYAGAEIPFHGEVATLPWDWEIVEGDAEAAAVRFSTRCQITPFAVERTMRLEAGSSELVIDETVRNDSGQLAHLVWGHHCVVGAPFLERGCRLEVPATTIVTRPEVWEETARLEPGQSGPWPLGRLRTGATVDLRDVPGEEAGSHDDVYAGGLESGTASVTNPRLGLGFRLTWDASVFRWVVLWQAYGGAHELPLSGSYALGIEPWTSRHCLADALEAGEAVALEPHGQLSTTLRAGFFRDGVGAR